MVHPRLPDAFLLRLARRPEAEALVLRGGARLRQLLPTVGRRARDLDLVCRLPYDPIAIDRLIREVIVADAADGVTFDPDPVRLEWPWHPDTPGLYCVVEGSVEGRSAGRLAIDLRFALPLGPEPERAPLRGSPAAVWMCRPETMIGRKLQVLAHHGRPAWRRKDLADLVLLVGGPVDPDALALALDAAFTGTPDLRFEARELLDHPGWWAGARASRRWDTFLAQGGSGLPPTDLDAAVAAVRAGLAPVRP